MSFCVFRSYLYEIEIIEDERRKINILIIEYF